MYQALYRKYRPACFDDVVGQKHITDILKNELKSGKIFHAYLFTGPRGTGKTSCAKILAKAVNCLSPKDGDACLECESCKAIERGDDLDITEIDAASNNGVDNIRDLKEQITYTPTSSKYRVYIIDEVHMLSIGAFNALLKTLEEPPAHIVFILATTEVHKLPSTILSRCQRFDFHRISPEDICGRITEVAKREGFEIEPSAAGMIAALSDGGMRDALSTLDLCAARTNHITDNDVTEVCSLAGNDYCLELAKMIREGNTGEALKEIDMLHNNAVDLMRLCSEMITHYRNLMVAKTVDKTGTLIICTPEMLSKLKEQAKDYPIEGIINAINVFSVALDRMSNADRRTEIETAVVRLCVPSLDSSPDALLDRLEKIERKLKYSAVVPAESAREPEPEPEAEPKRDAFESRPDVNEPDVPDNEAAPAETRQNEPKIFEAWQDVMSELMKTAPLMAAALSGSAAYVNGDILLIDSENDQFFSLMRSSDPIYKNQIKAALQSVVGRSYRLGPYRKKVPQTGDAFQDILSNLKKHEVPGV